MNKLFTVLLIFSSIIITQLNNYEINLFGFVFSKEVTFVKKNNKVILLGIFHTGKKEYFKEIYKKYNNNDYFVLMEGLNGLDPHLNYSSLSILMGEDVIDQPNNFLPKNTRKINADMHLSNLNKNLDGVINRYFQNIEKIREGKIIYLLSLDKELEKYKSDLIYKRNNFLFNVLLNTKSANILIPWGIDHMIDLENKLINDGYSKSGYHYYYVKNEWNVYYNIILSLIK